LLTAHHIIFDGASVELLTRELTAHYGAFSAGLPALPDELPIQYADYARWQRQELQSPAFEAQLAYWRDRLADSPPALELPLNRPRPGVQTYRGARQHFLLPAPVSARLKAVCRREGVTPFMLLLAAFLTLLQRYSGQNDIVIGSPSAGRGRTELEGLIGLFVNTLVLRTDASGDPRFTELLARVREVVLGAFEHQDVPFERLIEELQPARSLSRTPFIQAWFVLQNASASLADLPALQLIPGLAMTASTVEKETAMFDLTLSLEESGQGLRGFWEYRTDLFDADTAGRLSQHFRVLLENALADTQSRLSRMGRRRVGCC
jgi:hypothetical protein